MGARVGVMRAEVEFTSLSLSFEFELFSISSAFLLEFEFEFEFKSKFVFLKSLWLLLFAVVAVLPSSALPSEPPPLIKRTMPMGSRF